MQNLTATQKIRKILIPNTKTRKIRIRSPKLTQKSTSTKRLFPVRPQPKRLQIINKLKSTIEAAYNEKSIPLDYLSIYFESIDSLDPRIMIKTMSKTISELNSDTSSVQYVIKSIKTREQCIFNIKNELKNEEIDINYCKDMINDLRILSIQVIECIQN